MCRFSSPRRRRRRQTTPVFGLGRSAEVRVPEAIWVVGGEQRGTPHWTQEWKLYKKALVVKASVAKASVAKVLDGQAGGRAERVLEYETPPQHCADDLPSIVFKAASIAGNTAYLWTQTEVLTWDFPSFSIRKVISLPCFNDLHHVAVAPDGRLFVAVTGLDAVAELNAGRRRCCNWRA